MGGGKTGVPEVLAQLHPLEVRILPHLKEGILLSDLAKAAGMQEVEASRAVQWLENKKALTGEPIASQLIILEENARKALKDGMPEQRFLQAVKEGAKTAEEVAQKGKLDQQEVGACLGLLKKQGLIELSADKRITLTGKKRGSDPADVLKKVAAGTEELEALSAAEREIIEQLRGRKGYVTIKERKDRRIALTALGKELAATDLSKHDFAERLTTEDLQTGAWRQKTYRAYDVTAPVPRLPMGKEHFMQEAIEHIRSIWLEMGFEEMEGSIVQSAFWNLDALFVPQDHPARETQDTFYLKRPAATQVQRDAYERVRDTHEHGGRTGSKGWQYRFSREESQRLLIRTHTTALSAQTLWKIRSGEARMPGKYFTVGPVFRNERVDWKHLFVFHQIEGIVVAKDVTFAHLVSYLRTFFAKMGFPRIRLRPHHFPYTEPSVEVDVWNPRKEQWVELGGAGVFRPEVTKPLIGEEVAVLAWGLGLERTVVEYFGLTDLRDLYRNDIRQLREMRRYFQEAR